MQHQLQSELRHNAALLGRLLTNFSPKIRDALLSRAAHGRLRLGGERSEVVLLASDIRGFTLLTSGMDTDDVMDLLNDYMSALVEAIFKHDGTVDRITGDGILAVFGSPEPDPLRHEKAVRAALAMQSAMIDVSEKRRRRGQPTCTIGIGVHCGEVLHGFIGSNDPGFFTAGKFDTVRRAAVTATSGYVCGADLWGWRVNCYTGGGATFAVRLPVAPAAALPDDSETSAART